MSRYPVFGPRGYDESLVHIAPQVTKADRQQGYSVDILEQGQRTNFHGTQHGPNVAGRQQQFAQGREQPQSEQSHVPQQPPYPHGHSSLPSFEKVDFHSRPASLDQRDVHSISPYKPPNKPWFRTTRGLVILFLVLLLLVGLAVGIGVGVSIAANKANADKKNVRGGQQAGGARPSGGQTGSGAFDSTALPSLPSLSLISLDISPVATATKQPILLLTGDPAVAVVQNRPATATPPQATRTTLPPSNPTLSVNPVCERFPTLPACQQL